MKESGGSTQARRTGFGFALVIIFLFFEYGRPQDKIGAIGAIRPSVILVLLMSLSWMRSQNFRAAFTPQTKRMLLLLLLIGIHVPLAANEGRAFQVAQGFLLLLPLVLSITLYVDDFSRLRSFMKWWTLLGMYVAINGIFGRGMAGSSFLSDENDVALLMNMMLPFPLCLLVYERRWRIRAIYLVAALLAIGCIVATSSRGGFVGLVAVLAVLWLATPRKILSLVVVGLLAGGMYLFANQAYWDDMATIQDTEESTAQQRLDSWEAGWAMFKDNPLGVGPNNFPVRFPDYQPDRFQRSMWGRQAHSIWFTLLPELGIPGVLIFLSLLRVNVADLWHLRRIRQDSDDARFAFYLSLAFLSSIAGYFAAGSFLSVLYYPHYWYLSAMIVVTRRIADKDAAASG